MHRGNAANPDEATIAGPTLSQAVVSPLDGNGLRMVAGSDTQGSNSWGASINGRWASQVCSFAIQSLCG